MKRETPSETARRILARHGLSFRPDRKPVLADAWHDLDCELTGDDRPAELKGLRFEAYI